MKEKYGKNNIDDPIVTTEERKVIARLKSMRQSEHWQSRAAGYKPELVFVIRDFEYKDEKQLKYNSVVYNIERVGDLSGFDIELVCSKGINKSEQKKEGD